MITSPLVVLGLLAVLIIVLLLKTAVIVPQRQEFVMIQNIGSLSFSPMLILTVRPSFLQTTPCIESGNATH